MRMQTMVLALLLGACGSASGQEVPVDTSSGGSGGSAAAPDLRITSCDLREETAPGSDTYWEWVEFDVDPGKTEVTVCHGAAADTGSWAAPTCWRCTDD